MARASTWLSGQGIDGSASLLNVVASHAFSEPGTYFPAVRVRSQRQGNVATPHAQVQNLERCAGRRMIGAAVSPTTSDGRVDLDRQGRTKATEQLMTRAGGAHCPSVYLR